MAAARLTFIRDYIFRPPESRGSSVKYLAGHTYSGVRQICAERALAEGAAVSAEPLDHDGDGLKGGSRTGRRRRGVKPRAAGPVHAG